VIRPVKEMVKPNSKYLLAIFVLVSAIGRAIPPAADGIPYEKEVG